MQNIGKHNMGLLVSLMLLLLVAGGGRRHANFADAAAPNTNLETPAVYWQAMLPGIPMPPAISDLLAPQNGDEVALLVKNMHETTNVKLQSVTEHQFITGPRKLGPGLGGHNFQNNNLHADEKKLAYSYKPLTEEDQKKVTSSHKPLSEENQKKATYNLYNQEDQKKATFSYRPHQNVGQKKVTFSYKPQVEDLEKKVTFSYKQQNEDTQKTLTGSYKPPSEDDQKKVTFSYDQLSEENQKKATYNLYSQEEEKKATFSYKPQHNVDQKKVTFSCKPQVEELEKNVTFSYNPHNEDAQKKVTYSYKTLNEEDQKKATFSYKPLVNEDNQKKVTYNLHNQEEQKKVTFSYKARQDVDRKKVTFSYKPQVKDLEKKVTFSYKPQSEDIEKKVTFSYNPHNINLEKKITFSYNPQNEDLEKKVTFSYNPLDEANQKEVTYSYKTLSEEEPYDEANVKRSVSIKGEGHEHAHHDHHSHDKLADVFFLEDALKLGAVIMPTIPRTTSLPTLLQRDAAGAIPFSTDRLADIVAMFAPASLAIADEIRWVLEKCEETSGAVDVDGETKKKAFCATSIEDLVELPMAVLGTHHVRAFSGDMPVEAASAAPRGRYRVAALRRISDESSSEMVTCHDMTYPYAVFYCHAAGPATRAYLVTLAAASENGAAVPATMEAVAVCHLDTSEWSPEHPFLRAMRAEPGDVGACHFLPKSSIVWAAMAAGEQGDAQQHADQ